MTEAPNHPSPDRKSSKAKRQEARQHMLAYFLTPQATCSDQAYDALMADIAGFEHEHPEFSDWDSPTARVLPPSQDPFPSRPHAEPMLSLGNLYAPEELDEWEATLLRALGGARPTYGAELKIDGLAISLLYEEGRLTAAVTRGDGATGEEVTRNVKTIRGLPHRLAKPVTIEVRGEVYYALSSFEKLNQDREADGEAPFKNPRNAAAGTLRMLDSSEVRRRDLDLFVYSLASPAQHATHGETLIWLAGLGLPVNPHALHNVTLGGVRAFFDDWKTRRASLDYLIDGIVVKVEQFALREEAGATSKSPRWAVALKFETEQATTVLLNVEIGVGRTGVLTPIAVLEPVQLGGTTVARATLHNYDQIGRLDLHRGDRVVLEKGGEIIPKVVAVDIAARGDSPLDKIGPPKTCPACQTAVTRLEGEVDFYCTNPACPKQVAEKIRHFVSRKAMDIESLGPALIDQLLGRKMISTVADLYLLRVEELEGLERMGKKSAANVIQALEESKTRPLERFLFGLGIRFVGERAARVLARQFGSLEKLQGTDEATFENVREIGAITAKSLAAFFADEANRQVINRCLEAGVNPPAPAVLPGGGAPLEGKTVVITGTLSEPRSRWKNRLEMAGATVTGSVSKKTDFLLAGENAGSKREAAERLGVRIAGEEEMNVLLGDS